MADSKTHQEHPLANILINVLIPVVALGALSKDPDAADSKLWHIGPVNAMIAALVPPLAYGAWHFIKTRKFNFFSGLGLFSVLLTGGLTIYLWNADGTVKENAGLFFALKEASIPFLLGLAVFLSRRTATPLVNVFLYNDSVFDVPRIERVVAEKNAEGEYRKLLDLANTLFASSFFLSTVLNIALVMAFFHGFDRTDPGAREEYNAIVGKITGWGFVVIGVPLLVVLFFTLQKLIKGLREVTGLTDEEIMVPR